ncbi:MAG: NfeD family protein [Cyanobacteria bacterium J06560_2]
MRLFDELFGSRHRLNEFGEGVVLETVRPGKEWVVRVDDVYWHAIAAAENNFSPGDRIRVIRQEKTKLIISPIVG